MSSGNGRADASRAQVRQVGAVFGCELLEILETLAGAEHVKLSGDAQHQGLMSCRFGAIGQMDVGVDQSGQQSAIRAFDHFRVGQGSFRAANPSDLSALNQHAAMLEDMLPVEYPNVTDQLRGGRGLAESDKRAGSSPEYEEDSMVHSSLLVQL